MTSANPIDPNSIRLTGENSFIRLVEGEEQTTRTSHWRVLYSPGWGGPPCCSSRASWSTA